ncbi:uncharacterized protein LOC131046593 [Cryptomeria japonica]|uniref:uncharacterized protein LOC131046593 n=1 Tax=Cryptomeria japonica TaxID=3369 RepID=UPI0027DA4DE9|nr:uncharacterized protein LOC131046593 [Cryptomeria japonica]
MSTQGGISRKMQMKFNKKKPKLESKIQTKWRKVSDIDFGHVDIEDFKKRTYESDDCLPSPLARKMMRNGIVHAAGFPPAMQCYELMNVDIGPTTKEQEVQELDDSVNAIKERLRREVEKKNKLKEENEQLKGYIQHLVNPINREEAAIAPPLILPRESFKNFEGMKMAAQEAKEWIAEVANKAIKFVEELAQVYD